MRTDAAGVDHPTRTDHPSTDGMRHIVACQECRQEFPEWARILDQCTDDTARN